MAAVVVALLLVLLLTLFRSRMPESARITIEKVLGVGYPAVVGAAFAALSMNAYRAGDSGSGTGFAVGGVLMVLIAVRAARRSVWKR